MIHPVLRTVLLFVLVSLSGASQAAPQVTVQGTRIDGIWSTTQPSVAEFRGLPYAIPPLGARRFKAPMPPLREPGTRRADTFAAGCFQDDYNTRWYRQVGAYFGAAANQFVDPPFSEDCLYLNVWTPHPDPTARLPVLVWFHGGSNKAGWSFEPNYLGAELAARGDLLVVTVGYRLGVFGFLAHPDLALADGAGNVGLMDQIAALRYVRHSIAAFGGDPARVTIAGESAGGADVLGLLSAPSAHGLYARAIVESGGYSLRGQPTLTALQSAGLELAKALGSPTLASLQQASASALFEAGRRVLPKQQYLPTVDGRVIPRSPAATLRRGLHVDLLVGSNANESLLYVDNDPAGVEHMLDELPAPIRPELQAWVASAGTPREAQDRLGSFLDMGCSAQFIAASVGHDHHAYLYRFTRVRPGAMEAGLGAYHGAEIPYVFGSHDAWLPTDAVDRSLGYAMMDYWAAFVATGNPNRLNRDDRRPTWPAYQAAHPQALGLGDTVEPISAPDHALCTRVQSSLYP